MSWWTRAKIESLEDRNSVNATIHTLVSFAKTLNYASELIYQTARGARSMVSNISEHKTLSSFPEITSMLDEADKVALDSPRQFAEICLKAEAAVRNKIADLEEERSIFTLGKRPGRLKGWVDDSVTGLQEVPNPSALVNDDPGRGGVF